MRLRTFITLALCFSFFGCSTFAPFPPGLPDRFGELQLNGGRTQSISVNPLNANEIFIATQFGGLWKTQDGGGFWQHVDGLNTVFAIDVQHSRNGNTLVATLARNSQTVNGGGIYVSRDGGATWVRPPTGIIPADSRIPRGPALTALRSDPTMDAGT